MILMLDAYSFDSYKKYLQELVKSQKNGGRGVITKISSQFRIPKSTFSQVFSGSRHFSPEQLLGICRYFSLSAHETDYVLALLDVDRAGTKELKEFLSERCRRLRSVGQKTLTEISKKSAVTVLSDRDKALFYSEWYFSAVRIATSISSLKTPDKIAAQLGLPASTVREILAFLRGCGLCKEEGGEWSPGPATTFIDTDSNLGFRHLQNWRIQAIRRLSERPILAEEEYSVSFPCSLDPDAMLKSKAILREAVSRIFDLIKTAEDEKLAIFNIDLLNFAKTRPR